MTPMCFEIDDPPTVEEYLRAVRRISRDSARMLDALYGGELWRLVTEGRAIVHEDGSVTLAEGG